MTKLRIPEAARRIGVSPTQLRHDMEAGLIVATLLASDRPSKLKVYEVEEEEVERFRRWRVKYRGAYYSDIRPEDVRNL